MMKVVRITGAEPSNMSELCYDSRTVKKGAAFVAIPGEKVDGKDFIEEAIQKGANTIITEREPEREPPDGVTLIVVPDAREALAKMADYFFDSPSKELGVIGITGTNGKTTVSYLIEALMSAAGHRCGRIGTTGYEIVGRSYPAITTTPESADLQKMLREAADRNAKYVALEVSSHALAMNRVDRINFQTAVYTNLTQDHLDFHSNMDDYFSAKARLFTEHSPKVAIVNVDDSYASRLLGLIETELMTYGLEGFSDVTAEDISLDSDETVMTLKTPVGSATIHTPLIGWHNVYNILAATSVAISESIDLSHIVTGLAKFKTVPGRFERVDNYQPYAVIVDYAHTENALYNAIKTARSLAKGRVITLFGCGGDRDKSKRPFMGKVAWEMSDKVIVTSDNPRTEDEHEIITEILEGIDIDDQRPDDLLIIPDRQKAITAAIEMAEIGDFVIIAGKGHEDYQIIGTEKHHFDDRKEAKKAIKKKHGGF